MKKMGYCTCTSVLIYYLRDTALAKLLTSKLLDLTMKKIAGINQHFFSVATNIFFTVWLMSCEIVKSCGKQWKWENDKIYKPYKLISQV